MNPIWENLTSKEKSAFCAFAERFGIQVKTVSENSTDYSRLELSSCFSTGIRFQKNTLWIGGDVAHIEDVTHDLGHAVMMSPRDRARFDDPESDTKTNEAGAMVIQWAAHRALDPDYPIGPSLEAFGYGFGRGKGVTGNQVSESGQAWSERLTQGRVSYFEARAYLLLAEAGVVLPAPCLLNTRFQDTPKLTDSLDDPTNDRWAARHTAPKMALLLNDLKVRQSQSKLVQQAVPALRSRSAHC